MGQIEFMAGPLHTRRLWAAPSPSRRGQELLVFGAPIPSWIVTEGNPLVGPHQSEDWFANYIESLSQKKPLNFLIMQVEKSILK